MDSENSTPQNMQSQAPAPSHWPWKYVTVSLIRHAESVGNSNPRGTAHRQDETLELTCTGQDQAERLGARWANVRINALYASNFKRAKDTAQALADANTSIHEVEESSLIGERCIGTLAQHYLGTGQRHAYIQAVNNGYNHPYVDRSYVPPGGGESLKAVNLRARSMLLRIMDQHGANIDTVPEEYHVEDLSNFGSKLESDPERHPDGIPHVVLVSHNVFLAEFYEMLLNWKKAEHTTTFTDFRNIGWCVPGPVREQVSIQSFA